MSKKYVKNKRRRNLLGHVQRRDEYSVTTQTKHQWNLSHGPRNAGSTDATAGTDDYTVL